MEQYHRIDDRVREKLEPWEVEAPPAVRTHVLNAVKPKKDKKTPFFWLSLFAGLMVLGGTGVALWYGQMSKQPYSSPQKPGVQATQTEASAVTVAKSEQSLMAEQQKNDLSDKVQLLSSDAPTTKKTQEAIPTGSAQAVGQNRKSETLARQVAANQEARLVPQKNELRMDLDARNAANLTTEVALSKNHVLAPQSQSVVPGVKGEAKFAEGAKSLSASNQQTTTAQPFALVTNPTDLATVMHQMMSQSAFDGQNAQVKLLNAQFDQFETRSSAAQLAKTKRKPFVLSAKDRKVRCGDLPKYTNVIYGEAFAGPRFGLPFLAAKGNEFADYLAKRENSEQPGLGWEAGIRSAFVFNRFWVAQAGLQIAQQNEVFKYDNPEAVREQINNVIVNGQIVSTDTVTITGFEKIRVYNRFHFIDVPVQLGMELRKGQNGMRVSAGAALSFLVKSRGMIFDTDGQMVKIEEANPGLFRNSASVSLNAQVQWFRRLTNQDRLFIEPYLVFQPMSITSTTSPVTQRYLSGGLRLGYAHLLKS